jgi:hypothetical protein
MFLVVMYVSFLRVFPVISSSLLLHFELQRAENFSFYKEGQFYCKWIFIMLLKYVRNYDSLGKWNANSPYALNNFDCLKVFCS